MLLQDLLETFILTQFVESLLRFRDEIGGVSAFVHNLFLRELNLSN